MERWLSVYAITALSLLAAAPARAATYYVATSGSDSNPGSDAEPWGSLYQACNTATAGDTVYVRGGTYNGADHPGVGLLHDCGGSSHVPIRFVAHDRTPVTFANYKTLTGWQPYDEEKGIYFTDIGLLIRELGPPASAITWANVAGQGWTALTGPRYFGGRTVPHAPSTPSAPSTMQRGQTLLLDDTLYIRLFNGKDPTDAVVRLPWGYGIHLYGAHDVVLDGINVSFALVGYQIEPDGRAEATNNVLRDADIGYVTDGVSAAAANVSVIGMSIHDAGTTKYEHGVYASKDGLIVSNSTFSRISGAPVHCNPACDHATISSNFMHSPRPYAWVENGVVTYPYYSAITLSHSRYVAVINNLIVGPFEYGVAVTGAVAEHDQFFNNTLYLTSRYGKGLSFANAHRGMHIINNVVVAHGAFFEETCYTTKEPYCGTVAPVIDHNTYYGDGLWVWQRTVLSTLPAWKSASGAVEDEEDDPGFTSPTGSNPEPGDFGLTSASSCVDSGDTLPAVPKDFTGLSRPQGAAYDRGAFELKPRS
jgi:hypothetical protein